MNSWRRSVSQPAPRPTVVVTRSTPDGVSLASVSLVLIVLELHQHVMRGAEQHLALLGQHQAARMAVEQRHADICSSALTCREIADCDRRSVSAAWVNDPASAAA